MRHSFLISKFFIAFALILFSCKKPAGDGGYASIKGTVWMEDWNSSFTVLNGETVAADYDVYIIYGDNVSYSDKTKTNYNGEFEFKELRKGKYKVYVYSKDKTLQSTSGDISIVKETEVSTRRQKIVLDRITIYK